MRIGDGGACGGGRVGAVAAGERGGAAPDKFTGDMDRVAVLAEPDEGVHAALSNHGATGRERVRGMACCNALRPSCSKK